MKMLRLALALSLPIALAACNGGPPADTGPEGDADTDADSDTDTDTDADGDADCDISGATPVYEELFGADGAVVGANPYTADAGLGAILAAKPADGETVTGEWVVTGAVVGAVGYYKEGSYPGNIWMADSSGTVRTYGVYEQHEAALVGGETISFTATELKNYYGTLEITALKDLTVTGSDKVWLTDGNAATLSYETHAEQFIYAWGEITSDAEECGSSSSCYDFSYGGNTTTLRILSSKGVVKGDCAQVVVPLGTYSGADQMDVSDLDWFDWID